MKSYIFTVTVVLALIADVSVSSEPRISPGWLFEPIKEQLTQCSQYGPDWRTNLSNAMQQAKAQTKNLLPDQSWSKLLQTPLSTANIKPTRAEAQRCSQFIEYYSDPMLSTRLRGEITFGILSEQASGCMAMFPQLTDKIRGAWISAFQQKDFDPQETLLDEMARTNWRQNKKIDGQFEVCEEFIQSLSGNDFEEVSSEKYIRAFLGPNQ